MPDVLTLREAAAWLRLSERSTYELARARRIPAVQLGGKWLVPRAALERWLAQRAAPAEDAVAAPPILAGSHDPLLDWAVRQSGCGVALRSGGSFGALEALGRGEALAAAVHVPDPEGGGFNEAAAREALQGQGAVGLVWAWRDQGLIVAPGNPLGLAGVADLCRPGLRVIGRQSRAGSHLLLVHLLTEAGLLLNRVGFLPQPALADDEVAAAVAEGRADAGFGIRAEARALGFVPVLRERFDLVFRYRDAFAPAVRKLLDFTRGEAFRTRADRLGGYDVAQTGKVAFTL